MPIDPPNPIVAPILPSVTPPVGESKTGHKR
jgi:hypothetical protein